MAKERETFEQYRPVNEHSLSTRQLKWGEWWLRRKAGFRYTFVGILLLIGVGGIGYGLFSIGYYFAVGQDQEAVETKHFLRSKVPFSLYHEKLAPSNPTFQKVNVLRGTDDLYDFVTIAVNDNTDWYVEIEYSFVFDSRETPSETIMLLPGQESIVAHLGYETVQRPGNAIIDVKHVRWYHVSAHLAPDPVDYVQEHSNVEVRNVQLITASTDQESDSVQAHRALFTLQNNTAYNFWSVPMYVLFKNGSVLKAIERTEVTQLKSGEIRDIDVRLLQPGLKVNNLEIYSYIPVFDDTIYMDQ